MTRIQDGLAALALGINPVDQILASLYVFASPDGRICDASAIQQFFLRDVAKVCQEPVDGAGFSVFVVSVCELQPSANTGKVAKDIIRAARTNKRFMAGLPVCFVMSTLPGAEQISAPTSSDVHSRRPGASPPNAPPDAEKQSDRDRHQAIADGCSRTKFN